MPYVRRGYRQFAEYPRMPKRRRGAGRVPRAKRRKLAKLFRPPRPGGASLVMPLKCGYRYVLSGASAPAIAIDQEVGLQYMINPGWFNRYSPMWTWIKINKVRIDIVCPYNIGQAGVGGNSLYKVWSKKASSSSEVVPNSELEWMNLQNAKKRIFRARDNTVSYYFTPAFEAPQGATTAKRLMYKQWFEMPSGPTQAMPHLGIVGHIYKVDGSNIDPTEKFNVNVTLYTQVKGVQQL